MLAAIATALVTLVLTLLYPHKAKPVTAYEELVLVNGYKYNIYEVFALVPLFFFISAICFFFYLLGNDVQEAVFAGRAADIGLYPSDSFWLVPGMCFGFGLVVPPVDLLYRLMLREEYPVYIEYTNRKHGYDGFRVARPLCMLCTVAGVVLSLLGLNWYTEINGDHVVINDFFALNAREYRAAQIRSITHYQKSITPEGKEEAAPHYKIVFSDGYVWDTSDNFKDVPPEQYTAIAGRLALQTGLHIAEEKVDAQ